MIDPDRDDHRWVSAARTAARSAILQLAIDAGAKPATRPLFTGAEVTVQDVDPLAGARAARQMELGALHAARQYVRDAREAGYTWRKIGKALGLDPGRAADRIGESVAEAAYTYAAGQPDTHTALRYGRSFGWTCPACTKIISDRGPCNGPADDEHGHAKSCPRLEATLATWRADWEAGQ